MRHAIMLALLVGCANHQNCGENGAIGYARFLEPKISCWELARGRESEGDYALCNNNSKEEWLCSGEAWCRPLGPPVKVERVQ